MEPRNSFTEQDWELFERLAKLNDREWSVFELLLQGKTDEEIQQTLWISKGTLQTYLTAVYDALKFHRSSLLRFLLKYHLVELKDMKIHELKEQRERYTVRRRKKGGNRGRKAQGTH